MIRLRVEWRPSAERDLLHGVPDLETITKIAATIEQVAASFGDPSIEGLVQRVSNNSRAIRVPVAGGRVVTGHIDAADGILFVTSIGPEPDPDADPEPDEYEDD